MKTLRFILMLAFLLNTPQLMAQEGGSQQKTACEVNFVVNRSSDMADYQATIALPKGSSTKSLAEQIKQSIKELGFRVDSEEATRAGATEITFLPNRALRDDWFAMTAAVTTASGTNNSTIIGLRSLGDSSLKQQTTTKMRSFMCGFLANLPSVKAAAPALAQDQTIDRGAAPQAKSNRRELQPKSELDVRAAQLALEPGDATIKGKACTTNSSHGLVFRDYLRNQSVFLYPVTPYLKEAIQLYEKARENDVVIVSPLITQMRVEGKTNNEGEFQFTRVKPGRYIVMAEHTSAGAGTYMRYDGSDTRQNGNVVTTTNYYSEKDFFRSWKDILKDNVTISKSGQVVEISLTPPFRAQGLLGGLLNRGQQKGTGLLGLSCSEWQL